ncbi:batten's disease protein Cln3 [Punctularia strigosozonata HHB-11173 SS5]|uniref:batten's disease protein Cln3 n=1 Tax=Punctularia strigosozonata (strain HHB-11173) TaxID=741275 RepID=UPI0004418408|nr:batten's disease protein Cln3 [Punctularia strigosozonata HHB-11173 SS5]EIN10244.1 batten's disease protein Cln3 [Punctularia strigosozonata HHB-11173 SS5]
MSTDEDRLLEEEASAYGDDEKRRRRGYILSGLAFFLFGLTNNVLYVIILSAALDLVPPATPKGIIAFCNIAPSLVAKVGWPYVLKGRIRYTRRLLGCCALSVSGMVVVAAFDALPMRLLGIGLASFSSGLGELTFLQLSTTYGSLAGHCVGYFASGTGAAGIVGSFLWWEVRGLGVREGVGLSTIMPFVIPLTYFFILPSSNSVAVHTASNSGTEIPYAPLTTTEDEEVLGSDPPIVATLEGESVTVALSAEEKWHLVRPLLLRYMLPLFCVYLFEYTINQGVSPTLLYDSFTPSMLSRLILKIIHSPADFYPFWQLVYQTGVFLSRSSISMGLPPLPGWLISAPAVIQAFILLALTLESALGLAGNDTQGVLLVFVLISVEGICGGLAYVNVYHHINQRSPSSIAGDGTSTERARQEQEFRIGSIGFSDSLGILLASVVSVPTEVGLCRAQTRRGKRLCRGL